MKYEIGKLYGRSDWFFLLLKRKKCYYSRCLLLKNKKCKGELVGVGISHMCGYSDGEPLFEEIKQ